jgi:hypothetical protein
VYLWCTLRFQESNGILLPNAPQIQFKLLLARAHPRRVVALCDPHALVPEKHGDTLQWDSREKQFHRECVTEPVGTASLDFSQLE